MLSLSTYSQEADTTHENSSEIFTIIETMPEFPGGLKKLHKIIEKNIRYPESAKQERIGGKVLTQFVIDTTGNVTDIKIVEGIREDIDREAIRLVSLLNGWTAATQGGIKVKVMYRLPLTFYPDDRFKREYKK